MPNHSAPTRYSAVAQGFHWLIAALIVLQFTLGWTAQFLPLGARKVDRLDWHKSFGMTILMLAVLRLLWRLFNHPPELPAGMSTLEKMLARATHILFYVFLFVMPLTGWMMSSAKNYSVGWFHQFTWPNLIEPNEQAFNLLKSTHDTLSWLLFALALLHVLAALKHHFWNKDDVLKRMLPFTKSENRT
jgi:cytochrome b561